MNHHARESVMLTRITWGDEVQANLYGTTATADGNDPAPYAADAMTRDPEGLDLGPLGGGQNTILAGIPAPWEMWYGPEDADAMADQEQARQEDDAPNGGRDGTAGDGETWRIPFGFGQSLDIPIPWRQPGFERFARRLGVGTLGLVLILVGLAGFVLVQSGTVKVGSE